mmetsp:Transcript_30951/g.57758  ORF Transcript_30951/g.57758 Transcript_30951/m.57758 type:complete len:534 (-) Transcript_30951:229-1830(-)
MGYLGLVYRYTGDEDLYFHLQRIRRFPEERARLHVAEVVSAVGFLHRKGYVHRDIKPENILLDTKGHVALTGFGLAKNLGPSDGSEFPKSNTFCGTIEYLAPEMLTNKSEHDIRCDWWSVGVLLYELTTGRPPFYSRSITRICRRILNATPRFPPFSSKTCVSVIKKLLNKDRRYRLGAKRDSKDVFAHPFFSDYKLNDASLKARSRVPVNLNVMSSPETKPSVSVEKAAPPQQNYPPQESTPPQVSSPRQEELQSAKLAGIDALSPRSVQSGSPPSPLPQNAAWNAPSAIIGAPSSPLTPSTTTAPSSAVPNSNNSSTKASDGPITTTATNSDDESHISTRDESSSALSSIRRRVRISTLANNPLSRSSPRKPNVMRNNSPSTDRTGIASTSVFGFEAPVSEFGSMKSRRSSGNNHPRSPTPPHSLYDGEERKKRGHNAKEDPQTLHALRREIWELRSRLRELERKESTISAGSYGAGSGTPSRRASISRNSRSHVSTIVDAFEGGTGSGRPSISSIKDGATVDDGMDESEV